MFYIFFLLFILSFSHANESIASTIPTKKQSHLQPIIEMVSDEDEDIDFDNLTDQMEESGIDFTIDEPSSLQLLLRKIGTHLVPLLPYYLIARKWTNRKISWLDKKQNQCAIYLYSLLAYCTITTNE